MRAAVLVLLFLAAFALRIHGIQELPLEFHPVRQYRSAFIARYYYYQHLKSVPAWKMKLAYLLRQRSGTLEPPLLEYLASWAYRISRGERVWIPRLFSSIFWLVGGVFLYLLSRKLTSADAALFSVAFYLLAPFSLMASRSFQPDPLMVMMFVASIYAIWIYFEGPSAKKFAIAAALSALAILIKPVCLFAILAAFISVPLAQHGLRPAIRNLRIWTFGLVALLPSLVFYGYGALTGGHIRYQAEGSFHLQLFFESGYWRGWFHMIRAAVGIPAFVLALLCIPLLPRGLARSLGCGLWAGYLIFGLVFNHHISTHSYYQLQFLPIVAFTLAAGASYLIKLTESIRGSTGLARGALPALMLGVWLVAIAAWLRANRQRIYYEDYAQVAISEQIGEKTAHTRKAIFLSYADGELLEYHGELIGIPWPWRSEMHALQGWARPNLTVEERYKEIIGQYPSDYLIVTEMGEYRAQPELGNFLIRHFPLLANGKQCLVFDLRSDTGPSVARARKKNSPGLNH
ncbi:MAG TPA: glycosyltransferase family 39 protein [Terriglobia bacterium]|nr:glycosyltransferase family 39 protein [Terriglobia bacterium]